MLPSVECSSLCRLSDVHHGFFTREGGVSEGVFWSLNGSLSQGNIETVLGNRRRVALHLGSKEGALFVPSLCHSARAVFVDEKSLHVAAPSADAVVTKSRRLAIGVVAADCCPVLLADGQAGVVAAVHAGWRGARDGVVENTIRLMVEHGAKVANIASGVGPCIRQRAYEVGPEFMEMFVKNEDENKGLFKVFSRDGRPHFDLAGYVVGKLKKMGVGHCEDVGICTRDDDRFFSYRRSKSRGENGFGCQISAIMLL